MAEAAILLGVVALVAWGFSNVLYKLAAEHHPPVNNLFYLILFEVLFTIPLLLFFPLEAVSTFHILLIILISILGFSGLFLYFKGIDTGAISVVAPITAASPVIAVILSLLFLGEILSGMQFAAIGIIIAGSITVSLVTNKRRIKKPEKAVMYAAAASVVWGVMAVLLAFVLDSVGWFMYIVIGRLFGIIALAALLSSGKINVRTSRKGFAYAFIGTVFDFGGFVAFVIGLSIVNASIITPVAMAFPALVVILAAIILKERMYAYQYVAIAFVVAGLVILSL